jgi:uncharacterized iron-regulated protein
VHSTQLELTRQKIKHYFSTQFKKGWEGQVNAWPFDEGACDQMTSEGHTERNANVRAAIDALVANARSFERALTATAISGLAKKGSASLDQPSAVFQ